jgi:hypothetical protein
MRMADLKLITSKTIAVLRRIRFKKIHAAILVGIAGAYLLFAWLALPGIIKGEAEKYVAERSGHHLTMDRPSFNPFTLSLHLKNLRLTEPDGKFLLSFDNLIIDFSSTSLFHRAYVFDEISLDGLRVSVAVLPHDKLNWTRFINAFQSKEKTSSELPRLIIWKFSLAHGRLDLADARTADVKKTKLAPLDLTLTELSTLPNEHGQYTLAATTNFGARIQWNGQVALKPMTLAGIFRIDRVSLEKLSRYAPLPPTLAAPQGMASFSTHYRTGIIANRFDLDLNRMALRIDGLNLHGKADPGAGLAFDRISISGGRFDLRDRHLTVADITLSGGEISAERSAKGAINLLTLFSAPRNSNTKTQPSPSPMAGWRYSIDHVNLNGFSAAFRDHATAPVADFALEDISAKIDGVSQDLTAVLPVHIALRSRDGGSFTADGTIVPANANADFQIKLDGLALTPAQPYVGHFTTLKLKGGTLSADGQVHFDGKTGRYDGAVAVRNLNILEADGKLTFLAWKSLSTTTLSASSAGLTVRELLLDGLDTRLIIAKDKSINFTQVLRQKSVATPQSATQSGAATPLPIRIARLRISRSQLEFADHSLVLPFGTHIHALSGTLVNISSQRGNTPARLQVQGQIDDYGMARAAGKVDLFKPTDDLDIKVDFTNVEMTRLTPYSATFAGRRITSGKLTLNLEYKIQNRQLIGNNRIIMDQLTLGERVESPTAQNLPLDLAIAILEDSDGRIDLGLPVSGSLDDPKFSYGSIIWKAITNVLTKIVTAPFRALGALFGDDDKFDGLVFDAGQPQLSPPEREKLARFAEALTKRPNLSVAIHGTFSDADRAALQDLQLRKAIAGKLHLSSEGDPGLLTPDQEPVKPVLEDLYSDRFGSGGLTALKDAFRKANPGALPESTTGKVMSAVTGIFSAKPTVSDSEIAAMKGGNFHALLYQKLRDAEVVTDAALQGLADARGREIMSQLANAKAPMERISVQAPEKVEAQNQNKVVPLKMDMAPLPSAPAKPTEQNVK